MSDTTHPAQTGRAGELPANQIGTFLTDSDTASAMTMHTGGAGMVVGQLPSGAPLTLGLFAPEPTTVTSVGSLGLVQLVAFRAIAVGARVLVQTSRPAGWETFIHSAAGGSGRISLVEQADLNAGGTPTRPLLILIDSESSTSSESRRAASWSTVLTHHDHLSQWNAASIGQADVALVQPLSLSEAGLAATALNLRDASRSLAQLPIDSITIVGRSLLSTGRVLPTSFERWLIGSIER